MTIRSRTILGTVTVCALVLSTACDKSKEGTGSSAADKPAASAAAAEGTVELSDDDVPVAEDYIEEATKEIDEDNLNAKLDEIEKEIGSE